MFDSRIVKWFKRHGHRDRKDLLRLLHQCRTDCQGRPGVSLLRELVTHLEDVHEDAKRCSPPP